MPEDLHRKARIYGAPNDLSFQDVAVQALWELVEPARRVPDSALPPDTAKKDAELVKRFLRFWHAPEGVVEPEIRGLLAKVLGVPEP